MNGKSRPRIETLPYNSAGWTFTGSDVRSDVVVLGCIAVYVIFLGYVGLPVAHNAVDGVDIRDTGLMLHYLLSQPNPVTAIFKATFGHVEGPLQYFLLNAYCYLAGDALPLTPATMQIPNTVFSIISIVFIWLIGLRIASPRTALLSVAAFALGPWLAVTIRQPWYFNTLSIMLQCATMYYALRCFLDPGDRLVKPATAVSLALYILTGMDWPSFFLALFTFIYLSSTRSEAPMGVFFRRSKYGLAPLACAGVIMVISVYWWLKYGMAGLAWSRIGYPFCLFLSLVQANSVSQLINNTILPWGPQIAAAFAGALMVVRTRFVSAQGNPVIRSFTEAMCVWLLVATVGVAASSGHPTYLYVLALPSAVLAGIALSRLRDVYVAAILLVMAGFQIYMVTDRTFTFDGDKKQRILAAAFFLIEHRPDLLSGDAKPIIAEGDAAAVASYMRAGTRSALVLNSWGGGSDKDASSGPQLLAAVQALAGDQAIRKPWFIMAGESLSGRNKSRSFWLGLTRHPDVRWLARFREENGKEIAVGEFHPGAGVDLSQAPYQDVSALAATYLVKYDRISFLKHNVEFVNHY